MMHGPVNLRKIYSFNFYNSDIHNCNTSNVCCLQNWKKRWEQCIKLEKSTSRRQSPTAPK